MSENSINLIGNISNQIFANSYIMCGIILLEYTEKYTISQANDTFFDLIGYTKEDMQILFSNRFFEILHPLDKADTIRTLNAQLKANPNGKFDLHCRICKKNSDYIIAQLSGKLISKTNEQKLICFSISDITTFAKNFDILQKKQSDVSATATYITNHKLEIQALRATAEIDLLTGIYNRMATELYIKKHLTLTGTHTKCALLIIDLDNFKQINDCFGHVYGDECLKEVGLKLKNIFRKNDIVGRVGGDEFFVFIKDYETLNLIQKKSIEICTALTKTYEKNNVSIKISASIGVCLYPEHGTSFDTLYEKADIALYKAKSNGKNNYYIFNSD